MNPRMHARGFPARTSVKKNEQGTWSRKEIRYPARFPLLCAKILVCLLQVMLLVRFDHQLMEHDNISIRQAFHWLHAQAHHRSTILDDLNITSGAGHAINTLGGSRTWACQVTAPPQVTA